MKLSVTEYDKIRTYAEFLAKNKMGESVKPDTPMTIELVNVGRQNMVKSVLFHTYPPLEIPFPNWDFAPKKTKAKKDV